MDKGCGNSRRHGIAHGAIAWSDLPARPRIAQIALRPAGVIARIERNDGVLAEPFAQMDHRRGNIQRHRAAWRLAGFEIITPRGSNPPPPSLGRKPSPIPPTFHK